MERGLRLAGWIGVLTVAIALIACAGKQTPKDSINDPGQMLFNGQTSSTIDCYKCHSGDGSGTWKGPNLGERVPKLSDEGVAKAIFEGPGMMPSYKGKIDDQQIAAITAWLRGKYPSK
jgi:mono/diheme cytochrome c family protein